MLRYRRKVGTVPGGNIPFGLLILIEIGAIVVGVLLGFTLNEWRENRNNQKIADSVLHTIAAEMNYNHRQIEGSFAYYHAIRAKIDSVYRADPERAGAMYGYQLVGWRGAMTPMLRSSAYQMALMTGIVKDIPFETANALSNIYTVQSILEKLDDATIINFSQDTGFTSLSTIRHQFNLYLELMPSVIGMYQYLGKPILEEYGYTHDVEPGVLLDEMHFQMQSYPGM
jgi:hypothetical protein